MSHFLRLATVLALLIAAPDVSAQSDQSDQSAGMVQRLLEAVQRVNYDEVVRLLETAADVNLTRPDGSTPLSWAALRADARITTALLEAGADPNTRDENGETPLLLACARGDAAVVRMLLEAGASLDVRRWSGDTPLLAAVHGGDADVVRLLLERGADVNEEAVRAHPPKW